MRSFVVFTLLVCSCGGGASNRLIGDWLLTRADGSGGIGLTLSPDDTYVVSILALTSPSSFDAQIEVGNYSFTASTITFQPTKWSCPGPDPVDTENYSFVGSNLAISFAGGLITLAPNNGPPSTTTVILTTGCFAQNGTFAQASVAPVSN